VNLTDHVLPIAVIRMTRQLMTWDRAHAGHPFTPITSMQPMIMPGTDPSQCPRARRRRPGSRASGHRALARLTILIYPGSRTFGPDQQADAVTRLWA